LLDFKTRGRGGAMPVTYNTLYMDLRRALLAEGVKMASLEASEIIRIVTGKRREEQVRDAQLYLAQEVVNDTETILKRRMAGEPIAYLSGTWEFYGMELEVTPDVLVPRADTEVLAAQAIDLAKRGRPSPRILDLCTGSGCVGLALAKELPGSRVVLADCCEGALAVAKRNSRRHEFEALISVVYADALEDAPANLGQYDIIVCNPPYIPSQELERLDPSVRLFEPRVALDGGMDGLRFFRSVARGWKTALRPGGSLLFECGEGQAPDVTAILVREGYGGVRCIRDLRETERVVIGDLYQNAGERAEWMDRAGIENSELEALK